MGTLHDINITGLATGKIAANLGDAHEHIVAGILIRLGFDVGIVDVSGTPYDLLIVAFTSPKAEKSVLRAQIKTVRDSVPFKGGSRGGVDREYKSDVKTYKYTTEHSDLILGIDRDSLDIYVVPTRFLTMWNSSIAKSKIQPLKNNWDILLNWNDKFLNSLQATLSSFGFKTTASPKKEAI
jgi:hypothetical protein